MGQKIEFDNKEYDVESLSDRARAAFASLQFVTTRMKELTNMQALLQRAKNSYVEGLKKEMIATKSGLLLGKD